MEHIPATTRAVASVVVTCAVGVLTAHRIPNQRVTARDLSLLVTSLCVPALLFSHMSSSFTPDMLSIQSAALLVFGLLASLVGGAVGFVVGRIALPNDPQLAFLTLVGCAFQNTVILPLGLISSLRVDWIDQAFYERAAAYVFVYSVMTSLLMWTVGAELIRHAAERAAAATAAQAQAQQLREPPASQAAAPAQGLHGATAAGGGRMRRLAVSAVKALWNAPFVATLLGVGCGLAGIARQESAIKYPVNSFLSAATVIGAACIPASLLLLGVNLRNSAAQVFGNKAAATAPPPAAAAAPAVSDGSAAGAPTPSAAGPPPEPPLAPRDLRVLTMAMSVTRLVVVPASVISIFHFIVRPLVPSIADDPSMILVLFVESTAPTAIACSLLFTVFNFRPGAFAQSVFFQYISVVVTASGWLTFTLWYIEQTTDVLRTPHGTPRKA